MNRFLTICSLFALMACDDDSTTGSSADTYDANSGDITDARPPDGSLPDATPDVSTPDAAPDMTVDAATDMSIDALPDAEPLPFPVPSFGPIAERPDAIFPDRLDSCAVYREARCADGTRRQCALYDTAADDWAVDVPAMTEQAFVFDRCYDLYHDFEGQTVDVLFTQPMPPGTPEEAWSAPGAFRMMDAYGDASGWTGTALWAAGARYRALSAKVIEILIGFNNTEQGDSTGDHQYAHSKVKLDHPHTGRYAAGERRNLSKAQAADFHRRVQAARS